MKYAVRVGGQDFTVEIQGDAVIVDGERVDADLSAVSSTPLHRITMNGVCRLIGLDRRPDGWVVHYGGRNWDVEVVDERAQRLREVTAGTPGPGSGEVVRAPMPGLVLRLEVEPGQHVERGTGILVLEAMKMENEICSSSHGVVTVIHVEPGVAVEKGAPLMEIGPAS